MSHEIDWQLLQRMKTVLPKNKWKGLIEKKLYSQIITKCKLMYIPSSRRIFKANISLQTFTSPI